MARPSGSPAPEFGPVSVRMTPILIVAAPAGKAKAGATTSDKAAPRMARFMSFIFVSPPFDIACRAFAALI
jgi:hypothetical protein